MYILYVVQVLRHFTFCEGGDNKHRDFTDEILVLYKGSQVKIFQKRSQTQQTGCSEGLYAY